MAAFSDRPVVMITGCSGGGIGYALARAFAEGDCFVVATARSRNSMSGLEGDSRFFLIELDVLSDASIGSAVSASLERFGRIDILVNNAGVHCVAPLAEVPISEMQKVFETNLFGPLKLIQTVVPHMAGRKKGKIVNVGSITGLAAGPWAGAYSSSKAALHSLTDTLRLELKPLGIDVILVVPGAVSSNFGASSFSVYKKMPEWKLYKRFEEGIRSRTEYSQGPKSTSAERFGAKVAAAVLRRRPPSYFTYGYMSGTFSVLYHLPLFLRDFIIRLAMKLPLS